jgi:hypothetical protein
MTPTQLAWSAAGHPDHPYQPIRQPIVCATCAGVDSEGVAITSVETPTTANHADIFKFGSEHVCRACAWMFAAGKGRPGNFIATDRAIEYLVISLESVVENKRPWLTAIRELALLPPEARVCGVLTTDVKPRLWPRMSIATVGAFGLYVHAPDYDVSEWISFDLRDCLTIIDRIIPVLASGYSKTSVVRGLLSDHARASSNISRCLALEQSLSEHRQNPAFLPSVLIAGVTKEDKKDVKCERTRRNAEPVAKSGNQPREDQPGLFQLA